ncbi:MAG: EamA family transporter [Saprospiraceae bacterium]|nr:EamA family transporter [Saprospiraceae bacterium]
MSAAPSYPLKAWLALAAVCIIWGTTYMANKVGVTHVPPLLFSAIRQITAGTLILGWFALRSGIPWKDKAYFRFQATIGFFLLSIGNGVSLVGLRYLDSGIAALLSASLPIVIVLLNLAMRSDDRPSWNGILGISLGMAGILFMSWDELHVSTESRFVWGLLFLLIALTGWAYGSLISKSKTWTYPVLLNAGIQMVAGGTITLTFSYPLETWSEMHWSPEVTWAMVYLVLIGSLIAYTSYMYALAHMPATIVSIYSYINPLIALVVGWAILDERLDSRVGIATLLILGGVYLVNRDYLRKRKRVRIP